MDRNNAKNNNSIYLSYNNNKVKQAWESSCHDHHHDIDDDDDDDMDVEHHDEFFYVDHEGMMMMAWPPRSYTCSFCKREFRSAQALGGHMNVHRRDRAQLRQLSQISSPNNNSISNPTNSSITTTTTTLNLNLPPNPSPNNVIINPPPTPSPKPALMAKRSHPLNTTPSPIARPRPSFPGDVITRNQFECFRRKNHLQNNNFPHANNFTGLGFKKQQAQEQEGNLKRKQGLIRLDLEMNINVADHPYGVNVIKEDLDLELRLGYN